MGSKVEYVDSTHMYASNYVRNSKAIGVLWAIFTICYAIICVVAFITPEWIGDLDSEYPGRFGLWKKCQTEEGGEVCKGSILSVDDFGSAKFGLSNTNIAFQGATLLVGVSCLTSLFTICAMLLFFFCQSTGVFHFCGWMQLLSGKFYYIF